jgi:transposase
MWKWRFSPLKSVFLFMKFIQGKPRNQWEMYCLDAHVDADNEVRLIDLFVDSLNLSELGFKVEFEENGRPAYHPGALLRLFIYGYLKRIRSSRQLEKEWNTPRNLDQRFSLKRI